jgi:tyrosinase
MLIPLVYLGTTTWSKPESKCNSPAVRREWRSLSTEERQNYIQAVHCLQDLPSELVGRGSIYDDFVYVHMLIGSRCTSYYLFT